MCIGQDLPHRGTINGALTGASNFSDPLDSTYMSRTSSDRSDRAATLGAMATNRLARGTLPPRDPKAKKGCDLSITCPTCMIAMQPEHAHYKCPKCGYRDSCCF